jgi:predicted amidophosphoribosyltransferase
MAADFLAQGTLPHETYLVPIPNTKCTIDSEHKPRTALLANAIATYLDNVEMTDILRWKESMESAHSGSGTRDPFLLIENLAAIEKVPQASIVLVDDVVTTGGHIKACARFLTDRGGKVLSAICAARTVQISQENPFTLHHEVLEY